MEKKMETVIMDYIGFRGPFTCRQKKQDPRSTVPQHFYCEPSSFDMRARAPLF